MRVRPTSVKTPTSIESLSSTLDREIKNGWDLLSVVVFAPNPGGFIFSGGVLADIDVESR